MLTCQKVEAFTHPGIPLTTSDLEAVKAHVLAKDQPWKAGYDLLAADGHSQLTYTMQGPFASVSRNPHINRNQWMSDMTAAFNLSLMWYFTENEAYAVKSRDILLAWAGTQTEFVGIESNLDLGDFAYAYGGSASILRGTWPGWTASNTTAVQALFNNVYWPASGASGYALGPANKGTLSLSAAAAVAVFCDDTEKFEHVLYLMRTSASCAFPNTLPSSEIGESARDQGHASGQWGGLAFVAEVFWKQGIDIHSYLDNRLLAVGEFYARKNLGVNLPYITFGTTDYLYLTDETVVWDGGQMAANLIHGAYAVRKGLDMPYTILRRKGLSVGSNSFMFCKSADNSTAIPAADPVLPTVALIGSGLTNLDIGDALPVGSGTYNNNVWTVTGGGTEMWTHNAESFHSLYKQVTGDFSIIAKVNGLDSIGPASRAGLMIRSDLTSTAAKRAWIALKPSSKVESYMHGWTEMRGGSNWEKWSRTILLPSYWIKIERIGDVIALFSSPDGVSWAVHNEGRFENYTGAAYIGLAVCAGANGKPCTATFSNVSITGGTTGVAAIPDAPYAVYASPGNGVVPLRWLSSFGATSYNVKRCTTSNGTFTTIATGIFNQSYIDNGSINNGTTYFYKVSAVNSVGESIDSPVESTIPTAPISSTANLSGIYKIFPCINDKVLTVLDNSTSDGANIIQLTDANSNNQKWSIIKITGTLDDYKIINLSSSKAFTVSGSSTTNGAKIEQRSYTGDNSQIWTISNNGNDTYSLIGKASGLSLDVPGSSTSDGTVMDIWQYAGAGNQRFIISKIDNVNLNGTYKITATHSSKVMDVLDASNADGASILQNTDNGNVSQQWTLTNIGGDNFKVLNVKSGKALDVIDNSTADGVKLEQRTYASDDNHQIWTITFNSDHITYKITGKQSGKSLNVTDASKTDGALMEIFPYSAVSNQKFKLTRVMANGAEELSASNVTVYPNPFSDILTVSNANSRMVKLELINSIGVVILVKNVDGQFGSLDVNRLPSGIYIVRVTDGQQIFSRKITKL